MSIQDLINLKASLSDFTFGPVIFNYIADEIKINHDKIDELDSEIDALEARIEALEA